MPTDSAVLSSADALELIAQDPESRSKGPADLREAADDFDREAHRKERLTAARVNGNRRAARLMAAKDQAVRLRVQARIVRSAADEIEERGAETVGQAVSRRFLAMAKLRSFLGASR